MTGTLIFVDCLTLPLLLRILLCSRGRKRIFYFDMISSSSSSWAKNKLLSRLFLFHVVKVESRAVDMRAENGGTYLEKISDDLIKCVYKIKEEKLKTSPLIKGLNPFWDSEILIHFFEQKVEALLYLELWRIALTKWIAEKEQNVPKTDPRLIINNFEWFSSLKEYAAREGVCLEKHRSPFDFKTVGHLLGKLFNAGKSVLKRLKPAGGRTKNSEKEDSKSNNTLQIQKSSSQYKIGIQHTYHGLNFDSQNPTDLFWLDKNKISYSDLVLYDYHSNAPIEPEIKEKVNQAGIKVFGTSSGVTSWSPSTTFYKVGLKSLANLFKVVLYCTFRYGKFSFYYFSELLILVLRYSYWLEFFKVNNIRLNINKTFKGGHAQTLAMEKLNGISVSYQYSISNMIFPSSRLSACEPVQFSFSSYFTKRLWGNKYVDVPAKNVIEIGYIYDRIAIPPRQIESLDKIKTQFHEKGVRFIISFFDENSADSWDSLFLNEEAAKDYKFLFEWLLADPTIGLICKPKKGLSLFERIKSIKYLQDQAMKTGRCHIIVESNPAAAYKLFPAQVARYSDMSIGLLTGGTASMEAALADVPTLLVDSDKTYHHPLHEKGDGKVVFPGWDSAKKIIELYRSNPQDYPYFGNWSPIINDLLSYRDGKACDRFSVFISYAFEAINQNRGTDKSIEFALKQFANKWE
jgi:hypothetical protein